MTDCVAKTVSQAVERVHVGPVDRKKECGNMKMRIYVVTVLNAKRLVCKKGAVVNHIS